MAIELKVPVLGESITEATIAKWLKGVGDVVRVDDPVVELETDKVTVTLPAPAAGWLSAQLAPVGATVKVGAVIGELREGGVAVAGGAAGAAAGAAAAKSNGNGGGTQRMATQPPVVTTGTVVTPTPVVTPPAMVAAPAVAGAGTGAVAGAAAATTTRLTPAQRQALREADGASVVTSVVVPVTGGPAVVSVPAAAAAATATATAPAPAPASGVNGERDQVVAMTPLRRRIAERLVEAQKTAAILTTFNEVDMSLVMELRAKHQDDFVKKHGIKLGFMSFFVKACVEALKDWPTVNAEIRGTDVVYKKHYDIGIAVGSGKGLVVPVLRDADRLGFGELEKAIGDFGVRARENKLTLPELSGGTFTISNGGIYGSMLSTPLLNMPQSGILGMHNIVKRAVVVNDQIVIRPMMFLALSYDHRLVDGREAVSFLVGVKNRIEQPERLMFGL
ncbi:MAG: 2-oxoglutarate dehydrogenase complex dihydrolipoyllysine-residue succinyltransferase [Deltaproteobacteria bacterium]|nr:2-oxoglutarate dehydrogenase complex dihydrolipoyllysine-residue succinyltransferase [Deltaproteobacteria bacterium]